MMGNVLGWVIIVALVLMPCVTLMNLTVLMRGMRSE